MYVVEDSNTHEKLVLKMSFVEETKKAEFEKVNKTWRTLSTSCDFVVGFKELFYEGPNSCIVMEWCEGGDLDTLIKKRKLGNEKFTPYEISKIMNGVLNGLREVHALNMVHRDIKPANILLTKNNHVKLADFNISRILNNDDTQSQTMGGTPRYNAPEILQGKGYSFLTDVYAVGAILYELLALTPAFTGNDVTAILANRYAPLSPALGYSAGLCSLAVRMLSADPSQRPAAADVLADPALADARMQGVEAMAERVAPLQRIVEEQQGVIAQLREENTRLKTEVDALKREFTGGKVNTSAVSEQELKTDILLSLVVPRPITALGYRMEKFIPTGKEWKKQGADATAWALELDNYTYEIRANSVYAGCSGFGPDFFGPHVLFNGKPETAQYGIWHTSRGGPVELVLHTKRAELFNCLYMQARNAVGSTELCTQAPSDFDVLGSSDGRAETYVMLALFRDMVWSANEERVFSMCNMKPYSFYKIVISKSAYGSYVSLAQLNFGVLKKGV